MAARRGHSLALDAITHLFGDVTAVRDITHDIAAGELVALLGLSSCGKTTLLRIIPGFLTQTRGRVLFDGEPVDPPVVQPAGRGDRVPELREGHG